MKDQQPESDRQQPIAGLTNRGRGRKIADLDALTKVDKERLKRRGITPIALQQREQIIKELIQLELDNGGTLRGTGRRKKAAEDFGVTVWTIDNWMEKYKAAPRRESLVEEKRGPQPGSRMSEVEEAIICFFYLFEKQKSLGPDGHIVEVKRRADLQYIYDILVKFAGFQRSVHSVRRYIAKLSETDPVVVALARHGKKYLGERLIPTLPNNVDRPNIRWQSDGRPLPIYITHNGIICTVTLLLIIDDFSQYIVGAALYPRVIRDEDGLLKRADFKKEDFGILLASAMRETCVRPLFIYTDNGSQFVALAELLEDLSDTNDVLTVMTNSIPGRPRGRGKIERLLGLFDGLLKDLPGFVTDEGSFDAIRVARKDPKMFTFERLCTYIQAEIDKLNKQAPRKNGNQTREELWQSVGALPAPSIRNLLRLVPEKRDRDAAISKVGFVLDNDEYEPLVSGEEDMWQWFTAVARGEYVPLRAIRLNHPLRRNRADKGWHVEVCLDRDTSYWCEGVPKGTQDFGSSEYNAMIGHVRKRAEQELADKIATLLPVIESFDALRMMKDVITKHPVLPAAQPESSEELVSPVAPLPSDEQPVAPEAKRQRKQSPKRGKASASYNPPTTALNWDDMPSLEELERLRQMR